MAEWIEKSLGEIAEITKLAGFEFTKYIEYNNDGEVIALRALNLRNGELDLTDIKRISRKVSDGLTRSKIYKDDILLTYTGNGYGDCAIIEENDKYHLAPNICKIVPNKNVISPYYLYCYIRSKAFYNQMSNNMTGSGQPTIPMKTIRLLKIPVPELRVQVNIANMLWLLNQKIRNNKVINYNLIDYLTPIENVRLVNKNASETILFELGLDKSQINRNVMKLSGGQQQRVAIARALVSEAPVILADEPTGNLDVDTASEIIEILKKLAKERNKCVIVVTHSKEVANSADIVLELRDRKLKSINKITQEAK